VIERHCAIFRAGYAMGCNMSCKTTKSPLLLAALIFRKGGSKFLVLIRASSDGSQSGANFRAFPALLQDWRERRRFVALGPVL